MVDLFELYADARTCKAQLLVTTENNKPNTPCIPSTKRRHASCCNIRTLSRLLTRWVYRPLHVVLGINSHFSPKQHQTTGLRIGHLWCFGEERTPIFMC